MKPANDNVKGAGLRGMNRSDVLFAGIATAIAALAIVAGLLITDPPWVVRKQRLDEQRASSLNMISDLIGRFNLDNGKLPESLDVLFKSTTYRPYLDTADPSTRAAYEYVPGTGRSFQLCAVFDLDSTAQARPAGNLWAHKAGRQCFDLTAPAKGS
jgi:hypothetical protein